MPKLSILRFFKSHILMTFLVYGAAIGLIVGAVWMTYQYVEPLPPSKVTLAVGNKNGAYYKFAQRYVEEFAREGFELEIVETGGAMDNLELMSGEDSRIDAAFMQGGIASPEEFPQFQSLGSLFYEPLWVFHNKRIKPVNLTTFKKLRIAIGPEGSGSNYLISRLLEENGITRENATLIELPYNEVLPQLESGKIDVMFIIAGVKSKIIEALAKPNNNIRLLSFKRATAYARTYSFLTHLELPQGGIDLARDLPRTDIDLLATTANLVVRDDLHPALKFLFLLTASRIHNKGDIFGLAGQFPNDKNLLFPLGKEGESFYENGPPFLMRYLPYGIAIMAERLKILLIPLLTLLFPLFKITPPAYRWQIRRRIFKWYKYLKKLDMEAYEATTREEAKRMIGKLERMDRKVLETSVPVSYSDAIYSLRIHIHLIQERLAKMEFEKPETSEG